MKGIDSLIAAVLLILFAVVISIVVSGWLSTMTTSQANKIRNNTNIQMQCQYADIYIKNATYNCSNNCTDGTKHITTLTVVNSGKKAVSIDRMHIRNTTGVVTTLLLNETKVLNVGDAITITNTTRATCSGINNSIEVLTVSTTNCPATAYDNIDSSKIVYVNC